MKKIVINVCYGGFSLSDDAFRRYLTIKGLEWDETDSGFASLGPHFWRKGQAEVDDAFLYDRDVPRDDPALVQVVEEMGSLANGMCAKLWVVTLEPGTSYRITEYDGFEGVETLDSVAWQVA